MMLNQLHCHANTSFKLQFSRVLVFFVVQPKTNLLKWFSRSLLFSGESDNSDIKADGVLC